MLHNLAPGFLAAEQAVFQLATILYLAGIYSDVLYLDSQYCLTAETGKKSSQLLHPSGFFIDFQLFSFN